MTRILRLAALPARPWPNGLGITRDVTGGLGAGTPGWLLSIADLTQDAAFSHFPGCDRVFTLTEGGPVTLTLASTYAMTCLPLVPASFPGDRPTHCAMGCPAARAYNLFFERARFDGRVSVRTLAARHNLRTTPYTVAIYCLSGTLQVGAATLVPGDTALPDGAPTIRTADQSAIALIVEIEPL